MQQLSKVAYLLADCGAFLVSVEVKSFQSTAHSFY